MNINYSEYKTDFDLSNGLVNLFNSGFYILYDRVVVPEKEYSDYIYILFNPSSGFWHFARLKSTIEPNIKLTEHFKNIDFLAKFSNKSELVSLNYISNPDNKNRITLSPEHMLSNGLKISLDVDAEIISNIDITLGFLNNKMDPLQYSKMIPVLERLNLSTRVTAPLLFAQLVEEVNGINVNNKSVVIRKIFDSLIKIICYINTFSKLLNIASNLMLKEELSAVEQKINNLIFMYSGNYIFPNFIVFGGVKKPLPKGWRKEALDVLEDVQKVINKIEDSILYSNSFISLTRGSGLITKKEALEFALTGPNLRASGIDIDLQNLNSKSILGESGSTWDRYFVRVEEVKRHVSCLRDLLDKNLSGPVLEHEHPSVLICNHDTAEGQINNFMYSFDPISLSSGDYFNVAESSNGLVSIFIRSKEDSKPYYMSIRTGSKTNVLAFSKALNQNMRSFEYFVTGLDVNGMEITGNMYE